MSQEVWKMFPQCSNRKMLYDFQKEILDEIDPSYLLAMDTGTGKTLTAIHHYAKWSKGEPLLIVAPPQKINEGGWERDIQMFCDYYNVSIEFETLSYGKLFNGRTKNGKREINTSLNQYVGWHIIFDEAHYIKNPTSERGKAALKLMNKATNFCLLTATPASNGWEDTYTYMIAFGYFKNKKEMVTDFAEWGTMYLGTRHIPKINGWKNQHILEAYYDSYAISINKNDALDLPPLIIKDVPFKKSTEYGKILKDRVFNEIDYDTAPKLAHGLRQYANQKGKLEYVQMLCEGTQNNIVIFYYYQIELEALKKGIKNKKIFEVNGQTSKLPKKETWSVLKNTVTLIQYMAGSAGIELQYANEVVFYTPTYSYQDFSQAMGRAYRNGQKRKVTMYRFITQNTIEQAIYEALENKEDFSEMLYMKTKLLGEKLK